jgi:hypothetical protein
MPIRLLSKNNEPFAYTWGYHGAVYTIKKYGVLGAKRKAWKQAAAAHIHGWKGE